MQTHDACRTGAAGAPIPPPTPPPLLPPLPPPPPTSDCGHGDAGVPARLSDAAGLAAAPTRVCSELRLVGFG